MNTQLLQVLQIRYIPSFSIKIKSLRFILMNIFRASLRALFLQEQLQLV